MTLKRLSRHSCQDEIHKLSVRESHTNEKTESYDHLVNTSANKARVYNVKRLHYYLNYISA